MFPRICLWNHLVPGFCLLGGFFLSLFIFEKETETERKRGRGRERGRNNLKQAPGSELSAQSLTWAQTHEPQDHDLSPTRSLNPLTYPGAPCLLGVFWSLIRLLCWLSVCSSFLFPPVSVLVVYVFLEIYPFLLHCPICWHIFFHNILMILFMWCWLVFLLSHLWFHLVLSFFSW